MSTENQRKCFGTISGAALGALIQSLFNDSLVTGINGFIVEQRFNGMQRTLIINMGKLLNDCIFFFLKTQIQSDMILKNLILLDPNSCRL